MLVGTSTVLSVLVLVLASTDKLVLLYSACTSTVLARSLELHGRSHRFCATAVVLVPLPVAVLVLRQLAAALLDRLRRSSELVLRICRRRRSL